MTPRDWAAVAIGLTAGALAVIIMVSAALMLSGCVNVRASIPLCEEPDGGYAAPKDNSDVCGCRLVREDGEEIIKVVSCDQFNDR